MFHPRRLKVVLLAFLLIGSVGLQGCVPLVFLAANPIITAAIIAAVPAIITVVSNSKLSNDQLEVKRLEAETARTNAVAGAAEKLNQQVVSQRQLELDLIAKQSATSDPALKAQLSDLQSKVAQDQQVIAQTLNTANNEANNLANDKGPLPGMTSGQTGASAPTGNPLTRPTEQYPAASTTSASAPLATGPQLTTVAIPGSGIAPRNSIPTGSVPVAVQPVTAAPVAAPVNATTGAVPANAVPNLPPVLGVSAPVSAGGR